jgi:hypothetical protein
MNDYPQFRRTMTTFKLLITTFAIAGASTLMPTAHAQTAGTPTPAAQASDPQDHSAHHPDAEPAQAAKPADSKMAGMQGQMMADMKAQDAKLEALATTMKAAKGDAKTAAIEELLTAMLQQHKSMRDGMMQMQGEMMMQMHEQMMKPMAGAK